jgi:hypothetical protein
MATSNDLTVLGRAVRMAVEAHLSAANYNEKPMTTVKFAGLVRDMMPKAAKELKIKISDGFGDFKDDETDSTEAKAFRQALTSTVANLNNYRRSEGQPKLIELTKGQTGFVIKGEKPEGWKMPGSAKTPGASIFGDTALHPAKIAQRVSRCHRLTQSKDTENEISDALYETLFAATVAIQANGLKIDVKKIFPDVQKKATEAATKFMATDVGKKKVAEWKENAPPKRKKAEAATDATENEQEAAELPSPA